MVANQILSRLLELANQVLPEEAALPAGEQPFQKPGRVLVVPSYFIGDNILLTPFLRNLRRNLGYDARIDMAASPPMAPFFQALPAVDTVFLEHSPELRSSRAFLEQRAYDTIFLCRYAPLWARAAMRAHVAQRVGFDLERLGIHRLKRWGHCLTHAIPSRPMDDPRPQVEVYLDILRQLGLDVWDKHLQAAITADDLRAARALMPPSDHRMRVLVHAGSGSPGKHWPMSHWADLLEMLRRRWNPRFFSVGTLGERDIYQDWAEDFGLVNLCGQTSLRQSIAVLSFMDLVITLDTSVAHMAALAGAPRLVVIYGPTNQRQWEPVVSAHTALRQVYLDLPCRPCPARTCEHKRCLRGLSAGGVMLAVEAVLRDKPAGVDSLF